MVIRFPRWRPFGLGSDEQITNVGGRLCRSVDERAHTDPQGDTPCRHGRFEPGL